MSKSNPKKAISAILPETVRIDALGLEVRPLTLASFAVLERIGSPMLTGTACGALDLIPSLYVLTHDPSECLGGDLAAKSLAWADGLPVTALGLVKDIALRQIAAMTDVIPEPAQKKNGRGHNGWIAALAEWGCRTYGWTWREVMFAVPASVIALFWRQNGYANGEDNVFHLSEIEALDNG